MNFSWLEDFLALAATGNFSRAAEQRHMTQPAFSRRIRALEDWLGATLFERASHPVGLTPAGHWFRDVAREMLERAARLPDQARAIAASDASTLRFAATHALSLTFLPRWLRGLESGLTLGPIQLVSDMLAQCETLLQQGKVQFLLSHAHALAPSPLGPPNFTLLGVGNEALLPVTAPDDHGKPRHHLEHGRSSSVPVLAYSAESGLGRVVRSVFGARLEQAGGDVVFTAHLATVLRSMALEGRGVAWLPNSLIEEDLKSRRLLPAGSPPWHIEIEIRLFRMTAAQSPAAEAFWSAVQRDAGAATDKETL